MNVITLSLSLNHLVQNGVARLSSLLEQETAIGNGHVYDDQIVCSSCGTGYIKHRRLFKIKFSDENDCINFEFADPHKGFGGPKGEVISLSKEILRSDGIPDLYQLTSLDIKILFDLIFNPEKDWELMWRRIWALLAYHYKHPAPVNKDCKKIKVVGPPRTLLECLEPLLVALYGLGFSSRHILKVLPLEEKEEDKRFTTIHKRIKKYIENDTECEKLHNSNKVKVLTGKKNTSTLGFIFEVEVRGFIEDSTKRWLNIIQDKFRNTLEIKCNTPLSENIPTFSPSNSIDIRDNFLDVERLKDTDIECKKNGDSEIVSILPGYKEKSDITVEKKIAIILGSLCDEQNDTLLADQYKVSKEQITRWKMQFLEGGRQALNSPREQNVDHGSQSDKELPE